MKHSRWQSSRLHVYINLVAIFTVALSCLRQKTVLETWPDLLPIIASLASHVLASIQILQCFSLTDEVEFETTSHLLIDLQILRRFLIAESVCSEDDESVVSPFNPKFLT